MKIPKSIIISGITYTVILNSSLRAGARSSAAPPLIEICTKDEHKQNIFEYFIHEVLEQILILHTLRYEINYIESRNENYMFVFNHKQFEDVTRDLAFVVRQITDRK